MPAKRCTKLSVPIPDPMHGHLTLWHAYERWLFRKLDDVSLLERWTPSKFTTSAERSALSGDEDILYLCTKPADTSCTKLLKTYYWTRTQLIFNTCYAQCAGKSGYYVAKDVSVLQDATAASSDYFN
jgi:hypothetical protein